jgi:hypothetical protein
MWGRLQMLAEQRHYGFKFNSSELRAVNSNGSEIWIMGLDTDRDVDRLRGFPFRLVLVDEAQSVGADFENLVEDVIGPSLADFGGQLILSGTPNAACVGYFHDTVSGAVPGWSKHQWNILSNPEFPRWRGRPDWRQRAELFLDDYRKQRGWDIDHPTFQREWLGKWIRDEGGLVYRFNRIKHCYSKLPGSPSQYRHIFGVDLGFDDAFAIVVLAFRDDSPDIWQVDEYEKTGLVPSDWADTIKRMMAQYHPERVMVDTGGLGKAILHEFNQRHDMSVSAAEKTNKRDYQDLINSDYAANKIHLLADSKLASEQEILQWDDDRKREDPRFKNHLSDAFLYSWRECQHWLHVPRENFPPADSKEASDIIEAKLLAQHKERMRKQQRAW